MTLVIDEIHDRKQKGLDEQETRWSTQYLTIDPETMSQPELDKWKRDTQPLPIFVSESTGTRYHAILSQVEECLTKRRIQYIVMLYQQLTPEEQERLMAVLQNSH